MKIGNTELKAVTGDIAKRRVDAIVNAANTSLLGGGGVDGAIHKAAGPELVHECRILGGCKIGQAKLTKGYALPASHIIHTVGPNWQGGDKGERALLVSCYASSMEIARDKGLKSLAFPAISTGRFRFPINAACAAAVETVAQRVREFPDAWTLIEFVGFDDATSHAFQSAIDRAVR